MPLVGVQRLDPELRLVVDPAIGMTPLRWVTTGPVEAAIRAEATKLEFLRGLGADGLDLSVLPVERRRFLATVGRRLTAQALTGTLPDHRDQRGRERRPGIELPGSDRLPDRQRARSRRVGPNSREPDGRVEAIRAPKFSSCSAVLFLRVGGPGPSPGPGSGTSTKVPVELVDQVAENLDALAEPET